MPFSGEYPQYSNESPKKGGGGGRVRDRSMAELLRQLPVRGRLGIHVMDSVDSLLQLLLPNPSLRCPATAGAYRGCRDRERTACFADGRSSPSTGQRAAAGCTAARM